MRNIPPWQYVLILDLFFDRNMSATQVRNYLNENCRDWDGFVPMSREAIHRAIREASRRRYYRTRAPYEHMLSDQMASTYRRERRQIRVVDARGVAALDQVVSAAAEHVVALIRELATRKPRVHIGLGGGRTVRKVSQTLTEALREERSLPNLVLHNVVGGFDPEDPYSAPITYFPEFEKVPTRIEYRVLYAPPVASPAAFRQVREVSPGKEAFNARHEIDVVITSLAAARDEHGQLRRFMELQRVGSSRTRKQDRMLAERWLGELQGLPYDHSAPLRNRTAMRPVCLFELSDLVQLARQKDKFVVLAVGPCARCGKPKGEALLPLLTEPKLAVWTHLATDVDTARQVLPQAA